MASSMVKKMGERSPMRIGCSGWNYKSWRGRFYPPTLRAADWLTYYAERFDTVEVNNTFYRLPERQTFEAWRSQMPGEFLCAVKASRFLTHMKRLREPREPLSRLFSRATGLQQHLGPVLYQLPGNFHCDLQRLESFLRALPRRRNGRALQHVFEFRHPSWYVAETFELLRQHDATLCLHDKEGSTISSPVVGPFVYVRFHGTSGRYHGSYSKRDLNRWAHTFAAEAEAGRPAFAYFNNDVDAAAVGNARTLRDEFEKLV